MSKNEKQYNEYGNSMVKLLKNTIKKEGRTYHNIYIQVSPEGDPIQIDLKFWNYKVKNLLLAIATDCEITRSVKVSDKPELIDVNPFGEVIDGKKD